MDDQFPPKDENSAKADFVVPEAGPGEEAAGFSTKAQQEKFIGGASEQSQEQASLKSPDNAPDEQLTLKKAQTLFFLSFRFSQADGVLQDRIFEYLHSLHPEWRMSDEFKEQLRIAVTPTIKGHIAPKEDKSILHLPVLEVGFIDAELTRMQELFNRESANPPSMLDIAEKILDRDFRYLYRRNRGRPRSPMPKDAAYSPQSDPFLSHICYYGLEENSTKVEEYDRMFRDVRKVVLPTPEKKEMYQSNLGKLDLVVDKYAQTHPQSVPKLKSLGLLSDNAAVTVHDLVKFLSRA